MGCKVSKFIETNYSAGFGYETSLKPEKFFFRTRPWNKHISIQLHPPLQNFKKDESAKHTTLWQDLSDYVGVISVHVLVLESKAYHLLNSNHVIDTVIFPRWKLGHFYLETVYYYLSDMNHPELVLLTKNHFLSASHQLSVYFPVYSIRVETQDELVDFIANLCTHIKDRAHLRYFVDRDNGRRFEKILLELWLSQVGNCTLTFENESDEEDANPFSISFCESVGIKLKMAIRYEWRSAYLKVFQIENSGDFISLSVPNSDLRFISCRDATYSSFAFHELARVYEYPVWLMILVTFGVTIQVSKYIRSRSHTCIFLVKVALEQGDPMSNKLLKHRFSALVGVVVMLVGTVLTNGYKNANVYNMILPRVPIPYKFFEELYRDQFKIYCRFRANRILLQAKRKYIGLSRRPKMKTMEELCSSLGWREASEIQDFVWRLAGATNTNAESVVENARIGPKTCKVLGKSLFTSPKGFELQYFRQKELDSLIQLLKRCEKTAIILPYRIAQRVVQQNLGIKKQNLNIGIQSFLILKWY